MKIIGISVLSLVVVGAFALAGCAVGGESEESDAQGNQDVEDVDTQSQAQVSSSGGAGGTTRPWCAARKTCYDKCDKDYKGSPGPIATCKQLCDKEVESKCRKIGGGTGIVIL